MAVARDHFIFPNEINLVFTIIVLNNTFAPIRMDGADNGFPKLVSFVSNVPYYISAFLPFNDIYKFFLTKRMSGIFPGS